MVPFSLLKEITVRGVSSFYLMLWLFYFSMALVILIAWFKIWNIPGDNLGKKIVVFVFCEEEWKQIAPILPFKGCHFFKIQLPFDC